MKVPESLFHIDVKLLEDKKLFPFHLYIYHPISKDYAPFLFANSPLASDKIEFLDFILSKGGELAVDKKQKRTFLADVEKEEEDIPGLRERELTQIEKDRLELLKKSSTPENSEEDTELNNAIFDLKKGLTDSIKADNYLPLILEAKKEIEIFEVTISHTVSLAAYLAKTLLIEDNFTNRIVAISYFLTKNMDMKNEETLADIVCAAFFCHLGYTQFDHSISHTPELNLADKDKKKVQKHGGYSQHLIRKSGIELSDRCNQIITDHHERYNGSGYPQQKKGEFIDILALILGSISHILEFSEGRINGTKVPFQSVISRIKNKTFTAGLEFEFGDKIYENIINLITLQDFNDAA